MVGKGRQQRNQSHSVSRKDTERAGVRAGFMVSINDTSSEALPPEQHYQIEIKCPTHESMRGLYTFYHSRYIK